MHAMLIQRMYACPCRHWLASDDASPSAINLFGNNLLIFPTIIIE